MDGIDQWEALSFDLVSNRTMVLHNIDDMYGNAALTVGQWKLVVGTSYDGTWDGWYGPSGRDDPVTTPYDVAGVLESSAGEASSAVGIEVTPDQVWSLRELAEVRCGNERSDAACKPLKAPCLFNIQADPCEHKNLAERFPAVINHLRQTLATINTTVVPPGNLPWDPKGDPQLWDHTWTDFGDYEMSSNRVSR